MPRVDTEAFKVRVPTVKVDQATADLVETKIPMQVDNPEAIRKAAILEVRTRVKATAVDTNSQEALANRQGPHTEVLLASEVATTLALHKLQLNILVRIMACSRTHSSLHRDLNMVELMRTRQCDSTSRCMAEEAALLSQPPQELWVAQPPCKH